MGAKTNAGGRRSAEVGVIRGILIAAATSVVLVLLFACAVLLFDLGAEVITPVNQAPKGGVGAGGNAGRSAGGDSPIWCAGLIVGGGYMALGIALYCAFEGTLLPISVIAGDLALGLISGFLSGLLSLDDEKRPHIVNNSAKPGSSACKGHVHHV